MGSAAERLRSGHQAGAASSPGRYNPWAQRGTAGTVDTMSDSKAMNLRFKDPQQREAIAAAAREAGLSMQEFVLSAAYERATAVQQHFNAAFTRSMAHSGSAFEAETAALDRTPQQRAAEGEALRELEADERGHAA